MLIDLQPPSDGEFQLVFNDTRIDITSSTYQDENVLIADGVCLQIVHKGTQLRIAQPYGSAELALSPHFKPTRDGSCPNDAYPINYGLFLDFHHGGYPNLWNNLCHWFDVFYPLLSSARQRTFDGLTDVLMWQIMPQNVPRYSIYRHILRMLFNEVSVNPLLHFDNNMTVGKYYKFNRFAIARVPMGKRASFRSHFTGCARGYATLADRLHYRNSMFKMLNLHDSSKRTFLHLKRARVKINDESNLKLGMRRYGFHMTTLIFKQSIPFRQQFQIVSNTKILLSSHGAGLTHMTFMPRYASVIELMNCQHHSFMYQNLAMYSALHYQRVYASDLCRKTPRELYDSTRRNLHNAVSFNSSVLDNYIMIAMRYILWSEKNFDAQYEDLSRSVKL